MKYLWFKTQYEDIWKVSEDYSSYTIYYKNGNYITNYTCKTTKKDFTTCKRIYKLKEISEADVFGDVMKYLWFKDKYDNIWVFTLDYSYSTIYYKSCDYKNSYSCKETKIKFDNYNSIFSFKKIRAADALLEIL